MAQRIESTLEIDRRKPESQCVTVSMIRHPAPRIIGAREVVEVPTLSLPWLDRKPSSLEAEVGWVRSPIQ